MEARIKDPAMSVPARARRWSSSAPLRMPGRGALALTEAATRLADRPDLVPDEVREEAARHYDEPQLAALVVTIAEINAWNRLQAATRQMSGESVESATHQARHAAAA